MAFKDFRLQLSLRIILLIAVIYGSAYSIFKLDNGVLAGFLTIFAIIQGFEINHFVTGTNKKLRRFLDAIKYSDFATGFSGDNQLGSSFRELNAAFNQVLDAIRKARSEKEEHWQYLNTVVEHVSVGVLSFDKEGHVGLMNAAAKKLIGLDQLRNIEELIESNSWLYKALFDLPPGKSTLYRSKEDMQLAVNATEIKLAGTQYKLVALQNIQPELQQKELEAWQNLTRILRHEIMNSIAPISSLTSTLQDILSEEIKKEGSTFTVDAESVDDLEEGLSTIGERSKGLIRFINAYRDYTSIPQPDIRPTKITDLVEHLEKLMKAEFQQKNIKLVSRIHDPSMILNIDEEQIEQVLINLVKNAMEALNEVSSPQVIIESGQNDDDLPFLAVQDNGKGIIREALDKIFIPFYTTKSSGSGIGLALSRQIMQLHHGTIQVRSEPGKYTRFTLQF